MQIKEKKSRFNCPRIPERLFISYKSDRKQNWDLFVVALAIYNSFMIPIDFSFYFEWRSLAIAYVIDLMIDMIFLADVIIAFLTSFVDKKNGKEIFDQDLIAKHQLTQLRFWSDLLSLLGTDLIAMIHPFFKVFGFFKMFRVFRISSMIQKSNYEE